ncbi:MAG: Helix-turn-helix domain [Acidimicrobiaceae bacterium]|nr:Helix-turn-helix domain [Acidimicrobiaceae bacterium]
MTSMFTRLALVYLQMCRSGTCSSGNLRQMRRILRRMDFPALLAERMEAMNLSRRDVAERVGVDPSTVSRWLAHRRTPGRDQFKAVAQALGDAVTFDIVAAAVGRTTTVKDPTLRQQLAEALARAELLERENRELRAQIRRVRPPTER